MESREQRMRTSEIVLRKPQLRSPFNPHRAFGTPTRTTQVGATGAPGASSITGQSRA